MTEIDPTMRTYTHTITGPTAEFLRGQLEQFIKDMEADKETEFDVLEITPAIVISYMQRPIPDAD